MSDAGDALSRTDAPHLTLRYGDLPDQVVDVRLPASEERRPLVVVVHGGFWKAEFDRAHAGPQSVGLADAGYVVATVDYRRVGQRGGGWPGTFDDLAALTDAVPSLLADARPDRVDISRTVLVGHSAGGHLAAWAAARHRLPPESAWHRDDPLDVGVVSLGGVLDLEASERLGLGGHAARALLDGSPRRQPDRYALTNPAALVPTGGRLVAVHGADDEIVPITLSRRYVDLALAAGDPAELVEIAGCGHFELIDPLSAAWPAVLAAVGRALQPRPASSLPASSLPATSLPVIMKDLTGSRPTDPS
jgi:acetyl esterase/lipase